MPEQKKHTSIVKRESTSISMVSKSIEITNKLLAVTEEPFLIPYRKGDKWGFCDKNKKIIISCIFEDAGTFSEGLAAVKYNDNWGFIDKFGKEIIAFIYDYVGSFSGGFAFMSYNDRFGFIDRTGKRIIHCGDDNIHFSEGIFTSLDGYWRSDNEWRFYDRTGKLLYKNDFLMDNYPLPIEEGTKGYSSSGTFSEGLAAIYNGKKWGFIDTNGNIVIQNKYDEINSFSEGLASVCINGKWGFIDKSGKNIISCIYQDVCSFSEGLAAVCIGDKWGFTDKTGNEAISCIYDEVDLFRDIRDHRQDCYGGNWVYGNFGCYLPVYSFSEGLVAVKYHNNWRFIDKTGKEVISCNYGDVKSFSEGLAAVNHNEKWGFIDKTGKEVIPCIYDFLSYNYYDCYFDFRNFNSRWLFFSGGLTAVIHNGRWGFIDKSGTEFWED